MASSSSTSIRMRWTASVRGDDGANATRSSDSTKSAVTTCTNLKTAFHDCFNRWYSEKFVKGQWEQEDCMAEWEAYRACTSKRYEDRNLSYLLKQEPRNRSSEDKDR